MERETIKRERGDSSQQQVDEERAHGPHGPRVYRPRYILNTPLQTQGGDGGSEALSLSR